MYSYKLNLNVCKFTEDVSTLNTNISYGCLYIYTHASTCLLIQTRWSAYVYIYIYTHVYKNIYIYIEHLYMCTYMYIYICIDVYMHIYIYRYIYREREICMSV